MEWSSVSKIDTAPLAPNESHRLQKSPSTITASSSFLLIVPILPFHSLSVFLSLRFERCPKVLSHQPSLVYLRCIYICIDVISLKINNRIYRECRSSRVLFWCGEEQVLPYQRPNSRLFSQFFRCIHFDIRSKLCIQAQPGNNTNPLEILFRNTWSWYRFAFKCRTIHV